MAKAFFHLLSVTGSLKVALIILMLLLAGVLAVLEMDAKPTWALALPLLLFALNLLAAILTQPKFRGQLWLLAFHVSLLVMVLLAGIGRLTYLNAHAEVSSGQEFDGELLDIEQGPLHPGHYSGVRFENLGFDIHYHLGLTRGATYNRVRWEEGGQIRTAEIGDQTPLVLGGYRFYTSFNKGFAPYFTWTSMRGSVTSGTVHLPSWPLNEYSQSQEWLPPDRERPIWIQLQFEDLILDPLASSRYRVPKDPMIVVRDRDQRYELLPGETVEIAGGLLTFHEVSTWMGYKVFYDPTIPWLMAASMLAVLCLAMHFLQKFRGRPWDDARVPGT